MKPSADDIRAMAEHLEALGAALPAYPKLVEAALMLREMADEAPTVTDINVITAAADAKELAAGISSARALGLPGAFSERR